MYYKAEGIVPKKKVSFISKNLSHDNFFTKQPIRKLLNTEAFNYVNKLFFWSDCDNHFRSKEMVHFLVKQLLQESFFSPIQLNLFAEYHGKSGVDGQHGVLSRWLKESEITKGIKNIDGLIDLYREKSQVQTNQHLFFIFDPGARQSYY